MKFIEIPELDVLSRALNLSTPALKVQTRIEAYSCKAVAKERKLFKALESELMQDLSHSTSVSPPDQHASLLGSAFGPLDKRESRKILWLLIALLNVAFPDHDFSRVRPEDFRREESPRAVLASLSASLENIRAPSSQRSFSSYPPATSFAFPPSPVMEPVRLSSSSSSAAAAAGVSESPGAEYAATNPFLRQVLDPVIDLAECEVYSYQPDMDSDPHAGDSDDDSDGEGDSDAFEREDDSGLGWEMEGVDAADSASTSSFPSAPPTPGPSWLTGSASAGRAGGAMAGASKRFAPFVVPGTPGSDRGGGDDEDYIEPSATGGLLWSTYYFLYNKKLKRIVFISIWARRGSGIASSSSAASAVSASKHKHAGLFSQARSSASRVSGSTSRRQPTTELLMKRSASNASVRSLTPVEAKRIKA